MQIRNNKPKLNKEKARNVILYFLNKCGAMDKEKLMMLLYFVDFDYYEKYEESLTGLTYIKSGNKNMQLTKSIDSAFKRAKQLGEEELVKRGYLDATSPRGRKLTKKQL